MGSRYGRKKKRAHLERIAQLEYEATRAAVQAQRARNEANTVAETLAGIAGQVDQWDEDVRDLLGPHTAFAIHPSRLTEKVAGFIREIGGPFSASPSAAHELTVDVGIRRMEIYRFLTELRAPALDEMKRYLRMEIACGKEPVRDSWNYAVSRELFERGLAERDIIHIAEQIAVQFHERMKRELGRKIAS